MIGRSDATFVLVIRVFADFDASASGDDTAAREEGEEGLLMLIGTKLTKAVSDSHDGTFVRRSRLRR